MELSKKTKLTYVESEFEEDVYLIIDSDGKIITTWANWANRDFPEDLTIHREIGDLIQEMYNHGYKKALEDISNGK